ncbi:UNVERIFIED_CONTAM: dxr [Trichonephila clavipes]
MILAAGVAGYEWFKLMPHGEALVSKPKAWIYGGCVAAVSTLALFFDDVALLLWAASILTWLGSIYWVKNFPESDNWYNVSLYAIGFILISAAVTALYSVWHSSPWWLMYLFLLVWGADSGAYFVGRKFGKKKLAPTVSPNKSVEGLYGGVATTVIIMLVVQYSYLNLTAIQLILFLVLSIITVFASVLGDLFESMIKRRAGIKDSGRVLPGHGGVLDRIDSLLAAAPIFAADELLKICKQHRPKVVVVPNEKALELKQLFNQENLINIEILTDQSGLIAIAEHNDVDIVMAAIVGAAGLLPTLAAVKAGKRVLLANKESLVMSGDIMMQAARQHGALLLPVDSEHNAIFQSLPHDYLDAERTGQPQLGVSQILLTASGGPFLNHNLDQLKDVTPQQACKHPNWSMGQKISVDSATLMNKGLELIEACHLFSISEHFVTVVVHPQSIIHSMVQYVDGSTLAQMGNPDMCTPIAHALAWPKRLKTDVPALNLFDVAHLSFQSPDIIRFPALDLARQAMRAGGLAPTVLNAANEVAVAAFLKQQIGFTQIPQVVDYALQNVQNAKAENIDIILHTDMIARQIAEKHIVDIGG